MTNHVAEAKRILEEARNGAVEVKLKDLDQWSGCDFTNLLDCVIDDLAELRLAGIRTDTSALEKLKLSPDQLGNSNYRGAPLARMMHDAEGFGTFCPALPLPCRCHSRL
jgi:hypothetical protein